MYFIVIVSQKWKPFFRLRIAFKECFTSYLIHSTLSCQSNCVLRQSISLHTTWINVLVLYEFKFLNSKVPNLFSNLCIAFRYFGLLWGIISHVAYSELFRFSASSGVWCYRRVSVFARRYFSLFISYNNRHWPWKWYTFRGAFFSFRRMLSVHCVVPRRKYFFIPRCYHPKNKQNNRVNRSNFDVCDVSRFSDFMKIADFAQQLNPANWNSLNSYSLLTRANFN